MMCIVEIRSLSVCWWGLRVAFVRTEERLCGLKVRAHTTDKEKTALREMRKKCHTFLSKRKSGDSFQAIFFDLYYFSLFAAPANFWPGSVKAVIADFFLLNLSPIRD